MSNNAFDLFIAIYCVGRNYDSCEESLCQYAGSVTCRHPEHPRNKTAKLNVFHDDKLETSSSTHISTERGDLDTFGRPLRAGS